MATITRKSLMSLEEYAVKRKDFRTRVMAHKHNRKVHLGEHITLLFEDELTIRYQIQEMLRAERIFEEEGIVDELDAYNPLIPDGSNWKATMLIEYPDESERKQALAERRKAREKAKVAAARSREKQKEERRRERELNRKKKQQEIVAQRRVEREEAAAQKRAERAKAQAARLDARQAPRPVTPPG